ncbi:MAG TPA: hypothetical protein VMG12_19220 [Polyangiaceae bacterium]|nr:hypothetical protein [Polyangiaceae bacterium]
MTRAFWWRRATIAVALMGIAACSESEPNSGIDGGSGGFPAAPGGTGGGASSGLGGTGGARAGGSGSGGSEAGGSGAGGSEPRDGGLAHFTATRDGDTVRLTTPDQIWIEACIRSPRLVQRTADGWTPLRDDRPEGYNLLRAGQYVDGVFSDETCGPTLGCDIVGCRYFPVGTEDFTPFYQRFDAREYVQVGEAAAPTCDSIDAGIPYDPAPFEPVPLDAGPDAGLRQVPVIESRAPTGALGVEVRYYLDPSCVTELLTTWVEVE